MITGTGFFPAKTQRRKVSETFCSSFLWVFAPLRETFRLLLILQRWIVRGENFLTGDPWISN
jgi:hypothetical protein